MRSAGDRSLGASSSPTSSRSERRLRLCDVDYSLSAMTDHSRRKCTLTKVLIQHQASVLFAMHLSHLFVACSVEAAATVLHQAASRDQANDWAFTTDAPQRTVSGRPWNHLSMSGPSVPVAVHIRRPSLALSKGSIAHSTPSWPLKRCSRLPATQDSRSPTLRTVTWGRSVQAEDHTCIAFTTDGRTLTHSGPTACVYTRGTGLSPCHRPDHDRKRTATQTTSFDSPS